MDDLLEHAEGREALDELIEKGPPPTKRPARTGDPKAAWLQTNVRMDPGVKSRLLAYARKYDVPLEEVVHIALTRFLDDLKAGRVVLKPKSRTTRKTLL